MYSSLLCLFLMNYLAEIYIQKQKQSCYIHLAKINLLVLTQSHLFVDIR